MIDEFTLAELNGAVLRTIPIKEATTFNYTSPYRKDTTLWSIQFFISALRKQMERNLIGQ